MLYQMLLTWSQTVLETHQRFIDVMFAPAASVASIKLISAVLHHQAR